MTTYSKNFGSDSAVIPDREALERVIKKMAKDGCEHFHVLTDFDRTLTTAFVDSKPSPSIICQLRTGNYLTKDYAEKANALYEKYRPLERNASISFEQRNEYMREWWEKHFNLLVESGLTREAAINVAKNPSIKFRPGAIEFLKLMKQYDIPVIIMSASIGDMIAEHLKAEGAYFDNIYIIANWYQYDDQGKVLGAKPPIIHSLNKHEVIIKKYNIFKEIEKRKNVLLMGDGIEDIGMIIGFEYENMIKIGFLNQDIESHLESFKTNFDIVIMNDDEMGYVNDVAKEILN